MITKKYETIKQTPSDINEHLDTLRRYAEECETIIELGTGQTISTWAFLISKPKKFITVDIVHPSTRGIDFQEIENEAKNLNINFEFILSDSRKVDLPEHDLLFIDTLHNYSVLKEELLTHHNKTKKYIIFHDTISFGNKDEMGNGIGLVPAIKEFLKNNPDWQEKETYTNNNGLTVLIKKEI
jgi:hypothetical protein